MNEKVAMKKCPRNPEEYLASLILKKEFGLQGLIKSESPDWHTDTVGVEVVTAYPFSFNKSNGDYFGYLKHKDKKQMNASKSQQTEKRIIYGERLVMG